MDNNSYFKYIFQILLSSLSKLIIIISYESSFFSVGNELTTIRYELWWFDKLFVANNGLQLKCENRMHSYFVNRLLSTEYRMSESHLEILESGPMRKYDKFYCFNFEYLIPFIGIATMNSTVSGARAQVNISVCMKYVRALSCHKKIYWTGILFQV